MTDIPKHTKITTYIPQEDGSIKAVTESYFEELSNRKEFLVKQTKTDKTKFLSDFIASADPIVRQQTKELTIRIYSNDWNQIDRIVQEYATYKENFKRR